jgi:hypothetical protein
MSRVIPYDPCINSCRNRSVTLEIIKTYCDYHLDPDDMSKETGGMLEGSLVRVGNKFAKFLIQNNYARRVKNGSM